MRTYKFLGNNLSTIYPFSCFKLVYNYFLCTLGSPCGDQKESSKLIKKRNKKREEGLELGSLQFLLFNFFLNLFIGLAIPTSL